MVTYEKEEGPETAVFSPPPTPKHTQTANAAPRPQPIQRRAARLPHRLKTGLESLSGLPMDNVAVHYNSPKPATIQALAYAQGTDIYLGPKQEQHLPHEAWHVVQQMQGRVQPTLQTKGISINDNLNLEREADRMGEKALHTPKSTSDNDQHPGHDDSVIQQIAAINPRANVAQRLTKLAVAPVDGNSTIVATHHQRAGVHAAAFNWVLNNGAWQTVPAGEVCNHSRDYDSIAQEILDEIHDKAIHQAATYVKAVYEDLQGNNKGVTPAMNAHRTRLQNIIANPANPVHQDEVEDSFNYYMYKICDYPANLFYWPEKTDTDPDLPQGEHNDATAGAPWQVRNSIISKKKRLSDEKKRLATGRTEIHNALQ